MEAQHVTVDGSVVGLDVPVEACSSQPSSVGVFAVQGAAQEFTASYLEFGRDVATSMGVRLTEAYSYRGGTLRLGSKTFKESYDSGPQVDRLHLAVWEGRRFSVHTHLYRGAARDLIPIFDEFDLDEGATGIQLYAKAPKRVRLTKEPIFFQEFPQVGLLHVEPLTRQVVRTLPKWRGTRVAGGELFAAPKEDVLHFVLVGERSHTMVLRDSAQCDKEDLSHIAGVAVDWNPSPPVAAAM